MNIGGYDFAPVPGNPDFLSAIAPLNSKIKITLWYGCSWIESRGWYWQVSVFADDEWIGVDDDGEFESQEEAVCGGISRVDTLGQYLAECIRLLEKESECPQYLLSQFRAAYEAINGSAEVGQEVGCDR